MGKVIMSGIVPRLKLPGSVDIGTIWLFESNGTFVVPANGVYQVEMHGGGGGMGGNTKPGSSYVFVGTGGGSGEVYNIDLTKGDSIPVTIGAGGASNYDPDSTSTKTAGTGGTTLFGDLLSVAGGGGGNANAAGAASGSLASAGASVKTGGLSGAVEDVAGGEGNINNTAQTYGDGGYLANEVAYDGKPGAVIITYMGA